MIRFLPCEPLNGRAVRVNADHIRLHRFFHHIINFVITLVIAFKHTVCLPCTADGVSFYTTEVDLMFFCFFCRHRLYSNITSGKIRIFHAKLFPFIILSDNICNAGVYSHPSFRHLIYISVCSKLFRRVYIYFISCSSLRFKLQNT